MAATLMELKSKVLLPSAEEGGQPEDDPRQELVRQLLEYKRFKEAAALLEQQADKQASRLPRTAPPAPTPQGPAPLKPVELWDLVSAFGRLLRETLALQPQQITDDQTPLHQAQNPTRHDGSHDRDGPRNPHALHQEPEEHRAQRALRRDREVELPDDQRHQLRQTDHGGDGNSRQNRVDVEGGKKSGLEDGEPDGDDQDRQPNAREIP